MGCTGTAAAVLSWVSPDSGVANMEFRAQNTSNQRVKRGLPGRKRGNPEFKPTQSGCDCDMPDVRWGIDIQPALQPVITTDELLCMALR